MATWNERVRAVRQGTGLSQSAFGRLLGVEPGTVAHWEGTSQPSSLACETLISMMETSPQIGFRLLSERLERIRLLVFGEPEPVVEKLRRLMDTLGVNTKELAKMIGVTPAAVSNWSNGRGEPAACGGVLLDLLDFNLDEAAPLLWPQFSWKSILESDEPEEEEEEESASEQAARGDVEWPLERIRMLRESLGLGPRQLADLLHLSFVSVYRWTSRVTNVSPCYRLLLHLLETHGPAAADLMASITGKRDWAPEDVAAVRQTMGLTEQEIEDLLGPDIGPNFPSWERNGIKGATSKKQGCMSLLLSLLQTYPGEMTAMLRTMPR